MPGSPALIQQAYPARAERSRAFGVWGSTAGIAASAGPLLGGVLVSTVGWRWVFIINLPVGAACLVLTLRHVARSPRLAARSLDWPAQCAVVAAVASLTSALNEAGRRGWTDPAVLTGVGLAVPAAAAFVVRPYRGSTAGDLRHAPGLPGAGRPGGGRIHPRLPAAGGPDDGSGIRYLLRAHRLDRHGDGCRALGHSGTASAFLTTRQIGSATGVALGGSLLA
ncbi:MFS transporter [Streptomyces sp. enrichment culture]|uniref:MFS transporter n=1 Tax=Streptomyces sp. enrichment culture TaxID=1795815 RepID=UPI003F56C9B7